MTAKRSNPADSVATDLYDQPGHLIRRAHQISVATFNDVVGQEVTPLQYAILRMVHEKPGIDQVGLARLIALDTSTTALTAARLESKGLLARTVAEKDRRQLCLSLTREGQVLITGLVSSVHRMRLHLLRALAPNEQELFMELLRKFVHLNNEQSRAPFRASPAAEPAAPAAAAARTRRRESP